MPPPGERTAAMLVTVWRIRPVLCHGVLRGSVVVATGFAS
jgi:hypothetical protein